jgi:hypothetical protein
MIKIKGLIFFGLMVFALEGFATSKEILNQSNSSNICVIVGSLNGPRTTLHPAQSMDMTLSTSPTYFYLFDVGKNDCNGVIGPYAAIGLLCTSNDCSAYQINAIDDESHKLQCSYHDSSGNEVTPMLCSNVTTNMNSPLIIYANTPS